jgi:2-amino-4-hydroxy-6-hydroxymethyldihydropteridine diphosphokinase
VVVPTVYLALGSNLGDRASNLRAALQALPPQFEVESTSPCYETEPAYVLDQPHFLNLVVRGRTELDPLSALRRLKAIEADIGREPGLRFGPRLIDLDLLFYDGVVLQTPELELPHPRLHERAFVLVPLADLAPDLVHPRLGLPVRALKDRLGEVGDVIWPAPGCDAQLTQYDS